jgi:hypothetical protein
MLRRTRMRVVPPAHLRTYVQHARHTHLYIYIYIFLYTTPMLQTATCTRSCDIDAFLCLYAIYQYHLSISISICIYIYRHSRGRHTFVVLLIVPRQCSSSMMSPRMYIFLRLVEKRFSWPPPMRLKAPQPPYPRPWLDLRCMYFHPR